MKKLESSNIKDFFTDSALDFSKNYELLEEFQERQQIWEKLIQRHLPLARKDSICLDLGCGNGLLSRYVAKKGFKTIGFDQSSGMLSLARKGSGEEFESISLNFLNAALPLPEELYQKFIGKSGLILCSSVLEYVPDYIRVLEQSYEMLMPGGRMIISFANKMSLYRKCERILKDVSFFKQGYLKYQKHQFELAEIKKVLVRINFKVLEEEYFALPFQKYLSFLFGTYRGQSIATMFIIVVQKG
jgi:2-polyprenyl-3-methyl-5-hydroxy-6-metoxy-1,4-benzoquinol methylase